MARLKEQAVGRVKDMKFSQAGAVKEIQEQFGSSPSKFALSDRVYRKKAELTDYEIGLREAKRYAASLPMYA